MNNTKLVPSDRWQSLKRGGKKLSLMRKGEDYHRIKSNGQSPISETKDAKKENTCGITHISFP